MQSSVVVPQVQPRRTPLLPSGVLGMLIFVITELMLFAGLISAHTIARASAGMLGWPPPGQPRLPIEDTALNTVALIASGVALFLANRAYRRGAKSAAHYLLGAIVLGVAFVVLQGGEWIALLGDGMTLTSSAQGAYFYLIIGTHALHAVVAILLLGVSFVSMTRGRLVPSAFYASQVFWYFVVGIWPLLYQQVYL